MDAPAGLPEPAGVATPADLVRLTNAAAADIWT
jgi:hypothetical protein